MKSELTRFSAWAGTAVTPRMPVSLLVLATSNAATKLTDSNGSARR